MAERARFSSDHAYVVRNTFVEFEEGCNEPCMRAAKSVPMSCLIGDKEERLALFFADDSDGAEENESDDAQPTMKVASGASAVTTAVGSELSDHRSRTESTQSTVTRLPSCSLTSAATANSEGRRVRAVKFMLPDEESRLTVKNTFISVDDSEGETPVMRPFLSLPLSFRTEEDEQHDSEQSPGGSGVPRVVSGISTTSVHTPTSMCQLKTLSLGHDLEGPHLGLLWAPEGQEWGEHVQVTAGGQRMQIKLDAAVQHERAAHQAVAAVPRPVPEVVPQASAGAGHWRGRVWELSQDPQGCRQVQQVLDAASPEDRRAIAAELVGKITEATRSPHANFVLQKCISVMPSTDLTFITDEMQGDLARQAAKHKFGCRIVQRVIEKAPFEQVEQIIEDILSDFAAVARHPYGNYVIQNFLENASQDQRMRMVHMVQQDIRGLASDSFGCTVVSASMTKGPTDAQHLVAEALLQEPGLLVFTACTRHGHVAAARALQVLKGDKLLAARSLLQAEISSLRASRFGKNVADCL